MALSGVAVSFAAKACKNCSAPAERCSTIRPGLVQNCPTPTVEDAWRPSTMATDRSASAPGRMNSGLMLPISA